MLAKEGVEVVVHGRNEKRVQDVAKEIQSKGGNATIAIGDLATDEGADLVTTTALKNGPIDILVNNAGAYAHTTWMDTTAQSWLDTFNLNVVSYVRMVQRLLPQMKEQRWGRIVHIGGGLGIQP